MGVEKISNSGAMSYQGSAAVSSTAAASVEPVATSDEMVSQVAATPEFSFNTEEERQHAEELGMNSKQLKNAVNDLNKQLTDSEAIFGIHEKTNRVTIKIVDKSTKEVIKEFPPEQTLDMIAKVWEIAGILVDEKR